MSFLADGRLRPWNAPYVHRAAVRAAPAGADDVRTFAGEHARGRDA